MFAPHRSTILIVEDDEGIAELERQRLEEAGHRVLVAADAEEALKTVHEARVDLILLDYRLPGEIDGLEFYARVKAGGADVPVILVTGFSNEATVIQALRMGVRDFVTKSVEYLDYLPEAVGRVLKQIRIESQLAESEAQLASIIATAQDAILVTNEVHEITIFNAAAEKMFRCSSAEALGRPLIKFIPPEFVPVAHAVAAGQEKPQSLSDQVRAGTRGIRADGSSFPLEASISRHQAGGKRFHTIVVRDITERKKAEATLLQELAERRKVEERLRRQAAILERAHDAISIHDMDDRILIWNQGAERIYGWSADEAIGRNSLELLFKEPGDATEAKQALLASGDWVGELTQVTKDGRTVIVSSHWTLLHDEDGVARSRLVIGTDITEKKRLETQLQQAQRMESIGVLAGGVAHDFNNLLTVILGYSEMVLDGATLAPSDSELIHEIRRAGEQASSLTRQLLAFSRKQVLAPKVLDLNALIRDMEKMVRRLIGADIELGASLDPHLGRIKADPGQMEQVIMNLVVNARDAMPRGGNLTIETHNVELDALYAKSHIGVEPGPYVLLAVTDTGIGMDEPTLARVFEPFFTTKELGKGTGLGLSTVHGIIKQSGAHLEVYSELGRGTTFKIYLPRLTETGSKAAVESIAAPVPRGNETILLAEDDDGIRALARIALQSYGYLVLEAHDGVEGLRIGASHRQPIHLLISDVVMPKTSGRELVEKIRPLHPEMKVLYISGYTDDAIVRHGILEDGVSFLHKPFTPTTLARKVRTVLDGNDHERQH